MRKIVFATLAIVALLCSCSSDDAKSSENYIVKFAVKGITPLDTNIKNDQSLIAIYTTPQNYIELPQAKREIEVSQYATLDSNSKDKNWTDTSFRYIVTAENGDKRYYSIKIDSIYRKYSFETYKFETNTDVKYYMPTEANSGWTSGNAGIAMALGVLEGRDHTNPKNYPTRDTTGFEGRGVLMETLEGGVVLGRQTLLFSGNFVLGNFSMAKAISDELAATEVGRIYTAKPKKVKFYYKYKEGPGVFMNKGVPEHGRSDSCSAFAFFYRSDLPGGRDTTLSVKDLTVKDADACTEHEVPSELLVAKVRLPVCAETEGDAFKFAELDFEPVNGGEVDFENHRYKLGMTFASSKDGGCFAGKIGSKLIIDEVEFIDEE